MRFGIHTWVAWEFTLASREVEDGWQWRVSRRGVDVAAGAGTDLEAEARKALVAAKQDAWRKFVCG